MAEPATKNKTSSMIPDWTQLHQELLQIITKKLDNCFDVVHARSVCSSWRSSFPFPSCLLRPSYSFPTFGKFPFVSKDLCTLEKIPFFLFRVQTPPVADGVSASEYFLGGIGRDKSEDHMELPSPIQCSVKVEIPGSDPILMNIHDSQILPLGHQYTMIGWDPSAWTTEYNGVAFLPLNKDGRGGEFIVLLNYTNNLLVLRSAEMRWMRLKETSDASCLDLISFRGRFYATFLNGDIFAFDPYSLIRTSVTPSPPWRSCLHLVKSGDDELFLVGRFNPFPESGIIDFNQFICIVSRLDEEAGKWVMVSDLGDLVLFVGHLRNVCCSAKELPDGCGVSRNSIVFTDAPVNVTYAYKYEAHTGSAEDHFHCWRISRENRVTILSTFSVLALRVERQALNLTLDT